MNKARMTPVTPHLHFDVCQDLIVRTDWGHSSHPDFKNVSACDCRALKEGRTCPRKGVCIEARNKATWARPTKKTF